MDTLNCAAFWMPSEVGVTGSMKPHPDQPWLMSASSWRRLYLQRLWRHPSHLRPLALHRVRAHDADKQVRH